MKLRAAPRPYGYRPNSVLLEAACHLEHNVAGTPRYFDASSRDLGREARFRPAMREGKPVPFCAPYRITFAIRNS